jgi:hypothetical protein
MNRIFLALLALFAGISAQVSPAEARVRGETEIGAVLGQRAAARAAVTVQTPAELRAETRIPEQTSLIDRPLAVSAPFVPTVRLGPDRAHE